MLFLSIREVLGVYLINSISIMFSLTGVLLSARPFSFLRPNDFKPENVIFWILTGGNAKTDYAKENREKDVSMIHGLRTTKWGAVFVFISILIQQASFLVGNIKFLPKQLIEGWICILVVGLVLVLVGFLLAWGISERIAIEAEEKHEEKAKKSS